MSRDGPSLMELGVSLGIHHRYAGGSFDEAIKRVSDVNIDYPHDVQRLLGDWTLRRRRERPVLAERERKALGGQAGATLVSTTPDGSMSNEEIEHLIATRELRTDLPGGGKPRTTTPKRPGSRTPSARADLDPVEAEAT